MKEVLIIAEVAKIFEADTDDKDEAIEEVSKKAKEEINSIGWDLLKLDGYFLKKDEPKESTLDDEIQAIEDWLKEKGR